MAVVFELSDLEKPKLNYTDVGIERLKMVIRATLQLNSWSTRRLAKKAGISHVTVHKYVNGHLKGPQEETLKALSPYIYRLISITAKGIEIDPAQTYSDDWIALAQIATDNFCLHNSLRKQDSFVSTITEKIQECMRRQGLTQDLLENRLLEMIKLGTATMSVNRLKEIQAGSTFTDDELRTIRNLVDPYESTYNEDEWLQSSLPKPPTQYEQEDNNLFSNGVNGLH